MKVATKMVSFHLYPDIARKPCTGWQLSWLSIVWLILASSCHPSIEWETKVARSGTYSSPRATDLNGDHVKDIVIGAGGRKEWDTSENGVLALNGVTGELLWKKSCRNQIVGSPVFMDINEDGTDDIIIGGRSAQLMALDGKSGEVIWEYLPDNEEINFKLDTTILNFFNPQLVLDKNKDGYQDFIIAYGGYVEAKPNEIERPCGYLMIFSSVDGQLLSMAAMPDDHETYMSPVISQQQGEEIVYFGSGGETIPGNFYVTTLKDIMDGSISDHHLIIEGKAKGFIAPPILVNINEDDTPDIVVNAFEGITYAFDGKSLKELWSVNVGETFETHSQPAPGYFTGDATIDFFVNFGEGTWPDMEGAIQIIIDGQTGDYQVVDHLGNLQYSSPVVLSRKNGAKDLVLFPVNEKYETNYAPETGYPAHAFNNALLLFEFNEEQSPRLLQKRPGTNIGSTPLLEDLDGDGSMEMVYAYNLNPYDPFVSKGVTIQCITMKGYSSLWNQYMGAEGKSHF